MLISHSHRCSVAYHTARQDRLPNHVSLAASLVSKVLTHRLGQVIPAKWRVCALHQPLGNLVAADVTHAEGADAGERSIKSSSRSPPIRPSRSARAVRSRCEAARLISCRSTSTASRSSMSGSRVAWTAGAVVGSARDSLTHWRRLARACSGPGGSTRRPVRIFPRGLGQIVERLKRARAELVPCHAGAPCLRARAAGQVAEWSIAPVLKTGKGASPSWVQIPPCPPAAPDRQGRRGGPTFLRRRPRLGAFPPGAGPSSPRHCLPQDR